MSYATLEHKRALTIFGEEVICTTNDELRHDATEFLEFLLALRFDGIGGVRIATTDDSILEILAEVILGTEEIGVGEIQEREVFREIVLHDFVKLDLDGYGTLATYLDRCS